MSFSRSVSSRAAAVAAALGALLLVAAPQPARPAKLNALDVKAGMIGKIAEFVRWPASMGLGDPDRPFEFVILGQTSLEPHLVRYYRQVRIGGHRVFLRRAKDLSDVGQPHLLFIAGSLEDDLERIVGSLKNTPVLTVGDTEGFAERGVAINLYMADDQVRFEVSRPALQRHQLEASYHLLTLAKLVGDQQQAKR
ncbi:MAG TPA: YfiR family protein [Polyangia bacterium]|nr:YfiR family protein [Polyangia bacterium]